MSGHAALRGVFLALRRQGLPLGVRDYLDVLRALRAGFGAGGRQQLRNLCEALWARTEEEARMVRLLFADLPFPSAEEVRALSPPARRGREEPPATSTETRTPGEREIIETPDQETKALPVDFVPAALPGGVDIPRAQAPAEAGEAFVLSERPVIPGRSLVTAWRRFRRPLRTGPPVDLDVDATVAAKCRTGLVAEPVLVPARRNQARLTVLFDVSDSMLPWSGFRPTLAESLAQGQLGTASTYYFANVPADPLFREHRLFRPVTVAAALRGEPESCLLIVSDAGAARGRYSPQRVRQTADFLRVVRQHWSPVAWLNPMPRSRWPGSSASRIAGLRSVSMHELTGDGVIEAVDVLRGYTM